MAKLGRKFDDSVRKEERKCDIHGITTHGFYLTGYSGGRRWCCLECNIEKEQEYRRRKAAGEDFRDYNKHVEPKLTFCTIHNLALPATGICDYC